MRVKRYSTGNRTREFDTTYNPFINAPSNPRHVVGADGCTYDWVRQAQQEEAAQRAVNDAAKDKLTKQQRATT